MKGEIEKKNNFNRKKKNQKNKDEIEKKIIYHKFGLRGKIENNKTFTKKNQEKIKRIKIKLKKKVTHDNLRLNDKI